MIIVSRTGNLKFEEWPEFRSHIVSLESKLGEWTDYISILKIFLDSTEANLLIHTSQNRCLTPMITKIENAEYFDCLDVSCQSFNLARSWFRLSYKAKILLFNFFFRVSPIKPENFASTRMARALIRAKAIQEISNSIGAPSGVRVNFLTKEPTALILSRSAASCLIKFNVDNTIPVNSVFKSVLRSSNLSFGALL